MRSSCFISFLKTEQREKSIFVVCQGNEEIDARVFPFSVSETFKNEPVFSLELKHYGIQWVTCLGCLFPVVPLVKFEMTMSNEYFNRHGILLKLDLYKVNTV